MWCWAGRRRARAGVHVDKSNTPPDDARYWYPLDGTWHNVGSGKGRSMHLPEVKNGKNTGAALCNDRLSICAGDLGHDEKDVLSWGRGCKRCLKLVGGKNV